MAQTTRPTGSSPAIPGQHEQRDDRRRVIVEPRTIWLTAAVAVGLATGWVLISQALDVLVLLFIAVIIAEGIRPLVDWQTRRRVPRALAVLLIYLVALGLLGLLAWLIARPVLTQATALIDNLPRYTARLQDLIAQAQRQVNGNPQAARILRALQGQMGGAVQGLAPLVLRGPLALVSFLFNTLLVLLLAFFWLTVVGGFKGFAVGLFPARAQDTASDVIAEMGRKTGGYLRGVAVRSHSWCADPRRERRSNPIDSEQVVPQYLRHPARSPLGGAPIRTLWCLHAALFTVDGGACAGWRRNGGTCGTGPVG